MCGIAGIVNSPDGGKLICRMVQAMAHRGPDDEGIHVDCDIPVALGHTRLSIIDLSKAGHQPMISADGTRVIVFNGEIYNFRDLRSELEAEGFAFRTRTDTEVILASYGKWGGECVRKFRGMFALAIWDRRSGCLFLARDRLGIKPLYYHFSGSTFVFASEIKAILKSGLVPSRLDLQTLWNYMSYGAVLQPRTMIKSVSCLPPGSTLMIEPRHIASRTQPCPTRFWHIVGDSQGLYHDLAGLKYPEMKKQVRRAMEDATRLHLLSDVPVGAFLSGGVDSSGVVALMSRIAERPIKTFCVGFEPGFARYNELQWAQFAARHLNCEHSEIILTSRNIQDEWDRLAWATDQPSHDGLNTYFISKAAHEAGIKVALSGLGGDELFAGYPHFRTMIRAAQIAPSGWPWVRSRVIKRFASWLPSKLTDAVDVLGCSPSERYASLRLWLKEFDKKRILTRTVLDGLTAGSNPRLVAPIPSDLPSTACTTYAEINGYLVDSLLRDTDAMSMANSLEVRPVLLDHFLAELAFRLPDSAKIDRRTGKRILKDSLADLLPPVILQRPKRGFVLPLSVWLSNSLGPQVHPLLQSQTARSLFSEEYRVRLRQALENRVPVPRELWAVISLLQWMEKLGVQA